MKKERLVTLVIALIAVLSGVGLASRSGQEDTPAAAGESVNHAAQEDYETRLREIDRALQLDREQRTALAAEIADLRRELTSMSERVAVVAASATAGEEQSEAGDDPSRAEEGPPVEEPRGLDADALTAAGFSAETVRAFKSRVDQIELDRLYLRDLAAREGWLDTPRFSEEAGDYELDIRQTREEFGDEFYDWMLFTTGHPNRVGVGEVIDGSAAAEAGLLPGDVIVAYDDQRVFSPGELRDATTTGNAGESTAVVVRRGGSEFRVDVPRGPLGIRIDYTSEQPPPVS